MRVSVFGLGYVGCVSAACFAKAGHDVVGVDVNGDKVDAINAGHSPIVEPGLDALLRQVAGRGLRATRSAEEAIAASDLAMICVGTPSQPNGQLDVSALDRVAEAIGAAAGRRADLKVVLRSTVLPGTTEQVLMPALVRGAKGKVLFRVGVNPEFMREGSSLADFAQPPFTLVGSNDAEVAEAVRALYAGVGAPFFHTDLRAAEMAKYVSNAYHALKVCFANEIGDLCSAFGVESSEVMRIFLADTKLSVSKAYLKPGFAFGGSCLPKDLRALLYSARRADLFPPLLGAILPANDAQIRNAVETVLATKKRRIGVVGLSFKEKTDDLRESPMVALVETLIGKGCDVRVFDSNVALARLQGANRKYIEEQIPHIASLTCETLDPLLAHAEVLVLGNAGDDAAAALARAGTHRVVVDLTRGELRRSAASNAA
jgi:GDP-mannose 6-dehydrogenase